ncbi:MAG: hypothetical protein RL199_1415 [Pseudomonadota bacterium]|jgi:acyl-CoA thioester hydrolase
MTSAFVHPVRVLYADTDQGGIVYHANYLRFFEAARAELLRALGLPYAEVERQGYVFPVVEVGLRHRRPARYDDVLSIEVGVVALSPMSLTLSYAARLPAGEVCAEGSTRLACTRRADGRPVPLPAAWRALLASAAARDGRLPPRLPANHGG